MDSMDALGKEMRKFASAIQGWLVKSCNWAERLVLLAICATTFRPGAFAPYLPFDRLGMQILGVCAFFLLLAWQMTVKKAQKKKKLQQKLDERPHV